MDAAATPAAGPWRSFKEPEKPMAAQWGDAWCRRHLQSSQYLWNNNFLKSRSYGKMLLKNGLTKLEDGRVEPHLENDGTKTWRCREWEQCGSAPRGKERVSAQQHCPQAVSIESGEGCSGLEFSQIPPLDALPCH